jgi:ribosomal protein S18 acetylase RimI-like enzyme
MPSDATDPAPAVSAIDYVRRSCAEPGAVELAERLCADLFPDLPTSFVRSRLDYVPDAELVLALQDCAPIGFKLAYRATRDVLYSWLGGVAPQARRSGVASELMRRQHRFAAQDGFAFIETRTRTTNAAMLILNLKSGFQIVGLESDALGRFVAIQRKNLRAAATALPSTPRP